MIMIYGRFIIALTFLVLIISGCKTTECVAVPMLAEECENMDALDLIYNPQCMEVDRFIILCGKVMENERDNKAY